MPYHTRSYEETYAHTLAHAHTHTQAILLRENSADRRARTRNTTVLSASHAHNTGTTHVDFHVVRLRVTRARTHVHPFHRNIAATEPGSFYVYEPLHFAVCRWTRGGGLAEGARGGGGFVSTKLHLPHVCAVRCFSTQHRSA